MASTIEELEERLEVEGEVVDESDGEDDYGESFFSDLSDAMQLLKESAILLDFLANKNLCRAISKRERECMVRLSDRIHDFTEEVEPTLEEEDED